MIDEDTFLKFTKTDNWIRKLGKYPLKYKDETEYLILSTSYLPDTASVAERWWFIKNKTNIQPVCKVCGERTSYNRNTDNFREFCSKACIGKHKDTIDKRVKTSLQNWGVDNPSKSDKIKNKIESVMMEHYGVSTYLIHEDARRAMHDKSLSLYGTEYFSQAEDIKNKIRLTNRTRLGVDYPMQSILVKDKARLSNINSFGVEYPTQSKVILDKVRKTNKVRYGHEVSLHGLYVKDKTSNTIKTKYDRDSHTQSHIPLDILSKLNDREWLYTENHEWRKSLKAISKDIRVSDVTVGNYFTKAGLEVERFQSSMGEDELANFLSEVIHIERSIRTIIPPYELDIYIPSKKLAIEYNGIYWHSDAKKDKKYHRTKYELCKSRGIRLINIYENEWNESIDIIKTKLLNILNILNSHTVYARKCKVITVTSECKQAFFNANHIQGDGPSSINYGLEYEGELVACIGFIKHKDYYILNRYATSCNVPGGFTRLLKHFENEYNLPQIVTFADLRWSEGDLYKNTGFVLDKELPPDYMWTKNGKVWHKFNWRHTSGLKKLLEYDNLESESDNMYRHGFNKIWDCGKLKFIKNGIRLD